MPQCCVPSCSSLDIKTEKHKFTWDIICSSMGIGSIESPGGGSLCTQHYQQEYKVINATSRSDACKSCAVLARNCKNKGFVSCPIPRKLNLFSGISLHCI